MATHPVRRALLDRPQRLGFLPTWWFWNDAERQRLMMPLIAAIAVPLTLVFFFVMARLELPVWLLLVFGSVWPYLVLGLVERRIRRALRQRALDGVADLPAPTSLPSGDRVLVSLAGLGACGTIVGVAAAWGVGPALLAGLGLTVLAGPLFVKRERDAAVVGSNKPGRLPPEAAP